MNPFEVDDENRKLRAEIAKLQVEIRALVKEIEKLRENTDD